MRESAMRKRATYFVELQRKRDGTIPLETLSDDLYDSFVFHILFLEGF